MKDAPLTATLPGLGIVAAHGATPQALAEDVAEQIRFVLTSYALAPRERLSPDALELRGRLRAWLGIRDPLPPDVLAGAQQGRVAPASGRLLATTPIKRP